MVKADVSRDYYADLEISPTASEEEIKRAFRALAKAYHPDRNPGNEVDSVPKFQAVQAAHEVLSNPEQRRNYDLDRIKFKVSTPTVPRRGPVPPTPSPFPPPPRRAPPNATRHNPFTGNTSNARTRQPPPTAERYAPFARAGAQQREKTKEEAQSKADAFRGFQHMKPGQSPTRERFAPPPPPRPLRHPTASRPTSYAPQSAGPVPSSAPRPQRSWDDFNRAGRFTSGAEPSAGFPGLSRTQPGRKKQGFTPTTPGGDEPPGPRSSAYAAYSHGERRQARNPQASQSYFPETPPNGSPQLNPQRPVSSPLRHVRSSPGIEEDTRPQRPGLDRISTRYVGIGGERTKVTGAGLGRSSSVRNSPIDSRYHEQDRNGPHHFFSQDEQRRHRSISPKSRPAPAQVDSSSSDSDSSISEEEGSGEQRWAAKSKATPRQNRPMPASSDYTGRPAGDKPAFEGLFPGTNYVKPPTSREGGGERYHFRPPPPPRPAPASQAAFNYVPSYSGSRPTAQHPVPGAGNGYASPGVASNGPNMYVPFYPPPPPPPREWTNSLHSARARLGQSVPSLNGFPFWAVPSSVLPLNATPKKHNTDTTREEKRGWIETWRFDASHPAFVEPPRKQGRFADPHFSNSSAPGTGTGTGTTKLHPPPTPQSINSDAAGRRFSTSEWDEKFSAADDIFRPTSTEAQGRKSPVRAPRTRAKSYSKTQTSPVKEPTDYVSDGFGGDRRESSAASERFVPGKYSAEEWAERLRYQTRASVSEDETGKSVRRGPKTPGPRSQPFYQRPESPAAKRDAADEFAYVEEEGGASVHDDDDADVDAMDIDDSFPSSVPSTPSNENEVETPAHSTGEGVGHDFGPRTPSVHPSHTAAAELRLDDLANVPPLKPSDTGLGDLQDLNTTLPSESKPSAARPSQVLANGVGFSSLQALHLPKPPREVIAPLENVTQEAWMRYTAEMAAYMHDWHLFNKKMLDHFVARQAQLEITLRPNWMSALGDGPRGDEISRKVEEDGHGGVTARAGYTAYAQWMEEDMKVQEWWTVACERHREVVIELGQVRERAKVMAVA